MEWPQAQVGLKHRLRFNRFPWGPSYRRDQTIRATLTHVAKLEAENAELQRRCDPGRGVAKDPNGVYRDKRTMKANAVMVEQAARDATGLADQMEAWANRKVPD